VRERCVIGRRPAEKVDDIRTLTGVPPTQRFGLDSIGADARYGLLDLNLKTAMSQHEWGIMVNKHLHRRDYLGKRDAEQLVLAVFLAGKIKRRAQALF
jgi:hypothetical protein